MDLLSPVEGVQRRLGQLAPESRSDQPPATMNVQEKNQRVTVNNRALSPKSEFLFLWTLLWELEHRSPWPTLYSQIFHSGATRRTFHEACRSLNGFLRTERQTSQLELRSVYPGDLGSYRLFIPPEIQLNGNITESNSYADVAGAQLEGGDCKSAYANIIAGIEACPLIYQNFQQAHSLLNRFGNELSRDTKNQLGSTLKKGGTYAIRWLLRLETAFNHSQFPINRRQEIKIHLKALRKQISFIRKLISTKGNEPGSKSTNDNPLNIVLDTWRNPASCQAAKHQRSEEILKDKALSAYLDIADLTMDLLPSLKGFNKPPTQQREDPIECEDYTKSETTHPTLLLTLFELSENEPTFYFPEPSRNKDWRQASALLWQKATLGRLIKG